MRMFADAVKGDILGDRLANGRKEKGLSSLPLITRASACLVTNIRFETLSLR